MYREFALSTMPYGYFTLDGTAGIVDLADRASDLTNVTVSDMTASPPRLYQPIVPGYTASSLASSVYTPTKAFGVQGYEAMPFSFDIWIDAYTTPDPTGSNRRVWEQGKNILAVDGSALALQIASADGLKDIYINYPIFEPFESMHVGIMWSADTVALYVNGQVVSVASVPSGFSFHNTSANWLFTAGRASHLAIYDRAQSLEELEEKYSYLDQYTDHAQACLVDGAQLFSGYTDSSAFTDIVLKEELAGDNSIAASTDEYGFFSVPTIDKMQLSTGTLSQTSTQTTLSSGQYLYVSAYEYLSDAEWAISIETNDDNSRSGNEYLWTIANANERLECYVTSANNLVVKKTDFFSDGTSTSATSTFDTSVVTNGRKFVFVFTGGRLSAKTGATATVLNTVSGIDYIETSIGIDSSTVLYIGTSGDLTGNPVPVVKNLYTHRSLIDDDYTSGNYDTYQSELYGSAYWPLNSVAVLKGQKKQYLECSPFVPTDESVLNTYLVNKKSYKSVVSMTVGANSFSTNEPICPVPSSVIAYSAIPAGTIDKVYIDQQTETLGANRDWNNSSSTDSVMIRFFNRRRVYAEGTSAYIDLSGNGACWINDSESGSIKHNKYSGIFFESGSVGGPVTDPDVDGSTIRYSYRAVEFLLYVDSATANTGRILSLYNGSTEYYFAVNGSSTSTNMSNVLINNVSTTNIASLKDQWIHVYAEYPSLIQDNQLYVGKAYNSASYTNGIGIRNLATYESVLSTANRSEHFQCYLGRYVGTMAVSDSLSVAENASVAAYSPSWFTNIIPG